MGYHGGRATHDPLSPPSIYEAVPVLKGGAKKKKNPSRNTLFPDWWRSREGGGIYKEEELKVSSDEMKPLVWLDRCVSYVLVTFHL